MLQSLVRMCNTPVLRHIGFKEVFCLLDLPNAEAGSIVDLVLKKYRHIKFEIRSLKSEI